MISIIKPLRNLYRNTGSPKRFILTLFVISLVGIILFFEFIGEDHTIIYLIMGIAGWITAFLIILRIYTQAKGIGIP